MTDLLWVILLWIIVGWVLMGIYTIWFYFFQEKQNNDRIYEDEYQRRLKERRKDDLHGDSRG